MLFRSDRIVVMKSGRIQQVGGPQDIYRAPANDFVADFIGRGNLIEGLAVGERHVRFGKLMLRCADPLSPGRAHRFYVRPEDICLYETLDQRENSFYACVQKHEFLGAYSLVTLRTHDLAEQPLVAQFSSNYLAGRPIGAGATVRVGIPPAHLRPLPEQA